MKCRLTFPLPKLLLVLLLVSFFWSCGSESKIDESAIIGTWKPGEINGQRVEDPSYGFWFTFNKDRRFTSYELDGVRKYGKTRMGVWKLIGDMLVLNDRLVTDTYKLGRRGECLTFQNLGQRDPRTEGMGYVRVGTTTERSQTRGSAGQASTLTAGVVWFYIITVGVPLVLLLLRWLFIRGKNLTILSRWHHLYEDLNESSKEFYTSLEAAIENRNLPEVQISRVDHHEGGLFTAKRGYLRVRRREHIFDVCAAPFGNGFFFSWWLGENPSAFWNLILLIPVLGPWLFNKLRPVTYYRLDTATMFQDSIHSAVIAILDGMTKTKGLRSLSELERKPIMTELFKR